MRNWKKLNTTYPLFDKDVEVMNKVGEKEIASVIYLDDINISVWKRDDGYLFPIEHYIYWREINRRKLLIRETMNKFKHSKETFLEKVRDILGFKKKYWVLTCITEEMEIFSQDIFRTYEEAYSVMVKNCSDFVKTLGKAVIEDHVFPYSATILYDEAPSAFELKITCIEK